MRRPILLIVAMASALLGTALIVLYVKGIDQRATEGQEMVEVLTASATIEAGEDVASAQKDGKFEKSQVRRADVVDGALTTTSSITDKMALTAIYPGEQILEAKFGNPGDTGDLLIPDDKAAVSVELTDPARVAGFVSPGSAVAIFLTGRPTAEGEGETGFARLLLERVTVLGVGSTTPVSTTTTDESGASTTEQLPRTLMTLSVDQRQAEKILYAQTSGELAFGLLTENSAVAPGPGMTYADLFE